MQVIPFVEFSFNPHYGVSRRAIGLVHDTVAITIGNIIGGFFLSAYCLLSSWLYPRFTTASFETQASARVTVFYKVKVEFTKSEFWPLRCIKHGKYTEEQKMRQHSIFEGQSSSRTVCRHIKSCIVQYTHVR